MYATYEFNYISTSAIEDPQSVEFCYLDGEMKKQTHIATFKFVPRHTDEMFLDVWWYSILIRVTLGLLYHRDIIWQIYDPIHIETQYDDLWFEGLNMRTGEKGIFPSYYAQSMPNYLEEYTGIDMETIAVTRGERRFTNPINLAPPRTHPFSICTFHDVTAAFIHTPKRDNIYVWLL